MKRVSWMLALIVSTTASAQVTLQQMIEAAEKQNIDNRSAEAQRKRSEAEYRQAWTGLLPSVTVTGGYVHNNKKSEFPIMGTVVTLVPYDQFDGMLRVEVPLIDVARWYRIGASGSAEDSQAQREAQTRDAIKRQVVSYWYSYLGANAFRESARKSVGAAEAQAKLQEIRVNAGAATEIDRLRANAELARNQQQLADAETNLANIRRNLLTLTYLDPGEGATLPPDDLSPAAPLEELEARIGELPAVKAADKDVLTSNRFLTASRLLVLPTASAYVMERGTSNAGLGGQSDSLSWGVNLTWRLDVPTFMGMQVQSQNLSLTELAAERTRNTARDQIFADWQRQKLAITKVNLSKAQTEATQRAAQSARDRYAVGASTQLEVIFAERDVFGAEFVQIQARVDLAAARMGLKISAALPLFGEATATP